jgi:hypothetical protein
MASAASSTDGNTKYQAVVRYMHSTVMSALGKDAEEKPLSEEKVAALAKILEKNRLTPTRNDRRFPNTNQANNCWYVWLRDGLHEHERRRGGPVLAAVCTAEQWAIRNKVADTQSGGYGASARAICHMGTRCVASCRGMRSAGGTSRCGHATAQR